MEVTYVGHFSTLQKVVKCESPCYELEKINIDVTNPFDEAGDFRIVLVEASGQLLEPGKNSAIMKRKEKKRRKIRSKIDSGIARPETPPSPPPKVADTLQMNKGGQYLIYHKYNMLLCTT